ncbi:Diguanylate cyclase with PAS/PAC sensor [Pseudomonas sp. 8Z]|uniref:sensor domain-containing diguanylate cyclase n=1 Tax=Pseudomonas sp. 8Z TaxID=2653166 RepID=UPI0012F156E2|nr:diguanylate cyclase [Pseudomonas sp. 8Z]VXC84478.1 Diguanylate cyclase with PAS/PAC sensor [Pseudomonas sp. 8Z]
MLASSAWPARMALALLMVMLCTASVLLWRQLEREQQQRIDERIDYEARTLARQLENSLQQEVASLGRIARLWNTFDRLPRASWEEEVNRTLDGFPAYQSIQWRGPDLHMHWLLPLRGNESAVNYRLTPNNPNYALAMQARDTGEQRLSNSFELVQGGRGFVLYTPLYRTQDNQRVFDGFLQGVFRVKPLMDQLLTQIDQGNFTLELLEHDQPIYRHDPTGNVGTPSRQVMLSLLNNHNFSLHLSPTPALLAQLETPLPQLVLGSGVLISLLLVAALALAQQTGLRARAQQRANKLLGIEARRRQEIEQRLRENRERLQLVLDLTDSSHDGLFIFDTATRELLHMNQATYASLGYHAQQFAELLRDTPEKLMPGFHRWLEQAHQAQRDNLTRIFQRELIRRDGSRQPAEINTQLVNLHDREYLIAVSRDNSERLQLEEKLQRLSQLDGLTGLYNRRYFDQQLHALWRRQWRDAAPLALLMADIDYFKPYNDTLGHLAGDDALRRVGEALRGSLQREGDVACRYGGEEFVIILPGTDHMGAEQIAARLQSAITELQIAHPISPFERLTLSIGIAAAEPVDDDRPGALLERCDQALYSAKREGRNRTETWKGTAE